MSWDSQLAHEKDIEGCFEGASDFVGHRNAPARQGEDDDVAATGILRELRGERTPGFAPIAKSRGARVRVVHRRLFSCCGDDAFSLLRRREVSSADGRDDSFQAGGG
jgi:hypothetical protein